MRILAVSDIHGRNDALERVLERHPDIRTVVFLGDGLSGVQDVADRHPDRTFICVAGNCDHAPLSPAVTVEMLGGKRFLITHGHKYNVKYSLYTLELAARERAADIALFGHTHQPLCDYADGLYLCNPGSLGYRGDYAIIDACAAGILVTPMSIYAR